MLKKYTDMAQQNMFSKWHIRLMGNWKYNALEQTFCDLHTHFFLFCDLHKLLEYGKAGAVAKNLLILDLCTVDPVRAKQISKTILKKYF